MLISNLGIHFLTTFRLLSVLIIYYLLFVGDFFYNEVIRLLVAGTIYMVAGLTDYYDGKLARRFKLTSEFGKFYDSLVDKVFVLSVFYYFYLIKAIDFLAFWVIIIFLRDFLVTLLRVISIIRNKSISTDLHGKVKTVLQMIGQGILFSILLGYAIIFQTDSFFSLFPEFPKEYKVVEIPFSYVAIYFDETFDFNELLIEVISFIPNVVMGFLALITTYSGIIYFYKNRNIFIK